VSGGEVIYLYQLVFDLDSGIIVEERVNKDEEMDEENPPKNQED